MNIFSHPAYIVFVFAVIMPLNGVIFHAGQHLLAVVLAAAQLPWLYANVIRRLTTK